MALDLFAGIPVTDYATALRWYQQLPANRKTYGSGATKVIYRDAEGNEISFGGSADAH
jgi:hypothetical protein